MFEISDVFLVKSSILVDNKYLRLFFVYMDFR